MGYEMFRDSEDLKRYWRDCALPSFEGLLARIHDGARRMDADDFISDFSLPSNPAFHILYPPVVMNAVRIFAGLSARKQRSLRQDVFDPYATKWTEVCSALRTRFPAASGAIADFSSKVGGVLNMVVCAIMVEPGRTDERFVAYSDRYSEMQAAFLRIGEAVSGAAEVSMATQCAGPRREVYTDRFQGQDYLRDLVSRMQAEHLAPSGRQAVKRYLFSDEAPGRFAQEVDEAKEIIEHWGWRESTVINFTKPSHISGF